MTVSFHPAHLHFPSHVHLRSHIRLPMRPHLGAGARDSLWLFVALAILIAVATVVQWLFSMV